MGHLTYEIHLSEIAAQLERSADATAELISELGHGLSRDGVVQPDARWLANLCEEITDEGIQLILALAAALEPEGGEE